MTLALILLLSCEYDTSVQRGLATPHMHWQAVNPPSDSPEGTQCWHLGGHDGGPTCVVPCPDVESEK